MIWSIAQSAQAGGVDDYTQDTYYVVADAYHLGVAMLLPTVALTLIVMATFARSPRGTIGLWLALTGAAMIAAPGVVFLFSNRLGMEPMPRRYAEDVAATAASLNHMMTVSYLIAVAGLVCMVIGGAVWGVALRRKSPGST
jgi:cytochrome c oxidase subunit 1